MKKTIVALFFIIVSISLFGQTWRKTSDTSDSAKLGVNGAIDTLADDNFVAIELCYKAQGLKYLNKIELNIRRNNLVFGFVERSEYGADAITSNFTGRIINGRINVKFETKPVDPGDATMWTARSWILKGKVLKVPLKSKDYDTGKWSISYLDYDLGCD